MHQKPLNKRILANPILSLENSINWSHAIPPIKTSKKKETISEIIRYFSPWLDINKKILSELRDKHLDLCIVTFANNFRYRKQDLDNIAKILLDALKKSKNELYLFKDDSQIVRLLIYKLIKKDIDGFQTDSLTISFREHNPQKQMTIKEEDVINWAKRKFGI